MKSLPRHLEALGAELERAARTHVAARRRRRRAKALALGLATLLVATGVGLAASGVNLVGWLESDDRASVRYLVDTTRTYAGPAPQNIECTDVRAATFLCRAIPTAFWCENPGKGPYPCGDLGRSQRVYWLNERVEAPPSIERDQLFEAVDDAQREGMSKRLGERFTRAVSNVSDEFLARLNLLMSVGGSRTYRERPDGTPAVPPHGVPLQVTCEDGPGDQVRCRDVAGATDIPLRAPVYALEPTADWVPRPPERDPDAFWAELESFFGRELSEDENLVFPLLGLADDMTQAEWRQLEQALERAGVLE